MALLVTVKVADDQGNISIRSDSYPVNDFTKFPLAYSISRPLLQENPGALMHGQDWQNFLTDQDIYDLNKGTTGAFGYPSTPNISLSDTRQAVLEHNDPTFGTVVKIYQLDGNPASYLLPGATVPGYGTVQSTWVWPGIDKAWYRFTLKFQPGFTLLGPPGTGNPSWKVFFSNDRHIVLHSETGYVPHVEIYGGTWNYLPGSTHLSGSSWAVVTTEYTSGQWWEFIIYAERLSASHYRGRRWMREMTVNDVIVNHPALAIWERTIGWESVNASVPAGDNKKLKLGINKNLVMLPGQRQHFFWGPWEVIDGSVLPDPYLIESQIR